MTAAEQEMKDAQDSYEASKLDTKFLVDELRNRGFIVEDNTEYDDATGLLKFKSAEYYFDKDTRKLVPTEEAYKRASGGF